MLAGESRDLRYEAIMTELWHGGQYEWTVSKSRVTEYIERDGMNTVLNYLLYR